MSNAAQAWVNDHAPYSASAERAVLKELADAMNKDSEIAWQGIDRLALDSGYSRASVCRALQTMLGDGVIERASIGGGSGIKAGYRIVEDKRAWTLSRPTMAQMSERAGLRRMLAERKEKGLRVRQLRESKRVLSRDGLSGKTVSSEQGNSLIRGHKGGSHQLYEPDMNRRGEGSKREASEAEIEEARLNPRVGELVKGLVARMDIRARAGV
jgi:hypothetical protein